MQRDIVRDAAASLLIIAYVPLLGSFAALDARRRTWRLHES